MGLGGRVTDQDMQKIKTEVAEGFQEVFTKELDKAGYTVVDTTGADVLLIRPAIINLEVTAPDVMSPGISATIVSSGGSMTLYAELYDSSTSTKIAEVLDSEEVGHGRVQPCRQFSQQQDGIRRDHPALGRNTRQAPR